MRRRVPLKRTVLGASLLLLAACAGAAFFLRVDRVVLAEGNLAGGALPVLAPLSGTVGAVRVHAGDQVAEGDELLSLKDDALESALAASRARLRGLRERRAASDAERRRLVEQVHPDALETARRDQERAQLERDGAFTKLDRLQRLATDGLVPTSEVDEARLALQLADVALSDAKAAPGRLRDEQAGALAGLDSEARTLDAAIEEEGASLAELARRAQASVVRAPAAGVVLGGDLSLLVGRAFAEGDPLLSMAVATADRFEGHVSDDGRARVHAGQRVKVRLAGYPWLLHGTLPGTVTRVADAGNAGSGFPVTIAVEPDRAPGPLYDGMHGQARILLEERVPLGRLVLEALVGEGK